VRLAADANVLLSAVIGGRARLILTSPEIDGILTTEHTFAEVEEYSLVLAAKKRLAADVVRLAVAALPVQLVRRAEYAGSMGEARRRIGSRDQEDVELLALALHFGIAVWSNDRDFEAVRVELFTTERLLRHLRIGT